MFEVDGFVADCGLALRERDRVGALREVLDHAGHDRVAVRDTLGEPTHGGLHVLHRAPDMTVLHVVWSPGMTLTAHDHTMLAGIVVYGGREDNGFFRRKGDAVEAAGGRRLDEGDALIMGDDVIHSVHGHDDRYTGALHVYAGDFFDRVRSVWLDDGTPDPDPLPVPELFERAEAAFRATRGA